MAFWRESAMAPSGLVELALTMAFCSSFSVRPRTESWSRLARTRTAYFCEPKISTWATPGRVEMRGRMARLEKASMSDSRTCEDLSDRNRIGKSAGLTLRKLGGVGSSTGRRRMAAEICDCTSSAAPSMLRLRSNCRTIEVFPSDEVEVIVVTPAMVENCRSRIEATEAAIVSGLAPGSWAVTWMVGKSTRGTAATGRFL